MKSWFFKWILNNQAVVAFFHLTFDWFDGFDFHKDQSYFFTRHSVYDHYYVATWLFRCSFIYLIKPLVLLVERTGLNRTMSILVIYAILGLLLVWGISTAIPSLQNQF